MRSQESQSRAWMIVTAFAAMLVFLLVFTVFQTNRASAQDENATMPTPKPKPKPKPKPQPTRTQPWGRTPTRSTASSASRSTPRQSAPNIEMVLIPAGTFMRGSPNGVGNNDEHPQREVRVQSFYMGKYEVTQAQYRAVMGTNPSNFKGDDLPVETVSWNDAQEFIRRLNGMQSRYTYRLPSEAEWEYACRAGTTTAFSFGESLSSEQANFDGNYPYGGAPKGVYRQKTVAVGSFQANGFGLYDMHGNVWEWCEDWYHDSYNGAPSDGSAWISGGGQYRVVRGGSWDDLANLLRSAYRVRDSPALRVGNYGFRLVAFART